MFVYTFVIFIWMLFGPTMLFVDGFGARLTPVFRLLMLPALGFATVGVTIAAAGGASRERERKTLDGLLSLPRERDELLRAWWLGSVWHVQRLAGGLLGLGAIGCCVGSLHVLAFPLLLLAGAVHVGFGASLGLYLSVVARTTARAVLAAIVGLLAVCLLPSLAANFWDGLAVSNALSWPWVGVLLRDGLSPPDMWWQLTSSADDMFDVLTKSRMPKPTLAGLLSGLAGYAAAGLWLWRRACRRLER
jgi:ABC-type transport system involved in multi-copper enzyme maturation permease subunit